MESGELKEKLVEACKILYKEGLIDFMGHLSARISNDAFVITPRFASFSRLDIKDLLIIDLDGNKIEGNHLPPLELPMHQAIYLQRSDIKSVIHTHSKFATLLSIAGVSLRPIHHLAIPFINGLPIFNYFGMIDTIDKAKKLSKALGSNRAILLANHGTVVVGTSIEEACIFSIWLEKCAEMQLLIGNKPLNVIRDKQEASQLMTHQLEVTIDAAWNYYKRKIEHD
jgi:L-ribulose-5-phosphate 4-epimerase